MDLPMEGKSAKPGFWEKGMKRRQFIDWIIQGGLLATLLGMVVPALVYLWPVTRRGPGAGMVEAGGVEDIPVWGAKKLIVNGSPVLLLRTPKEYRAFSAICTHLGCLVFWNDKQHNIDCPCHAGVFDTEGRVVSGPPPKPLPTYGVSVEGGKVFIRM